MNKLDIDSYRDAERSFCKVLDILYGNDPLNLVNLESHLDNLCYYFDMNVRVGDLCIQEAPKRVKPIPFFDPIAYNKFLEGIDECTR